MAQTQEPEKSSSPCNCLNLRRAALSMTKLYDDYLVPSGLTVSQFSLLKYVKFLGPLSVSELADKIRLDRTTLVRNLLPLEDAGFIVDVSAPGTRGRALELTKRGVEKYEEAEKLWNNAQDYVGQALGKDDLEQLTSLLTRVENLN